MELTDYLRIVRQRWLTITVIVLLAVGAAAALTARATPQYSSSAKLFISTSPTTGDSAYTGDLFSQQRVKSYASLVTGEEMSRRVDEKLSETGIQAGSSYVLSAAAEPDTVLLSLTVTDPDPKLAQAIARATSEVFVGYVKELETPDGRTTAPVKASIVDKASSPGGPVSPQPVRNIMLGALLGLLLGGGAAVLRDTFDTSLKSVDDLREATDDAPLIGHIFFDKGAPKKPLITSLDRHAPRTESFRVLSTNLQFVNVDSETKVFTVTSAVPGEGKSTTAANLGIALAEAGNRVVLVEGDLRRPKAISYLKLEGTVGVTTVLIGRVGWRDAVQNWSLRFDALAAGSTPPNPTELLQSASMKRLVMELREEYDIVLIDAPPLLPVADAAVIASLTDGAILVVHHGVTTRDQVETSVERLKSVDARLIGTVMNMAPAPRFGSYGYGYGYGYGPQAAATSKKSARGSRRKADSTGAVRG